MLTGFCSYKLSYFVLSKKNDAPRLYRHEAPKSQTKTGIIEHFADTEMPAPWVDAIQCPVASKTDSVLLPCDDGALDVKNAEKNHGYP